MKTRTSLLSLLALGLLVFILSGCGGSAATVNDIPVYPGATELKEGENNVADTLAKNVEQDAALRQALNTGGKTEQKGFQLSAETSWDQIKAFYDKELPAKGWTKGLGGIANSFIDVNAVLDSANQGNDLFKTAIYSKDKQTLTVVMVTDPTDQTQKQLLFSLSTQ
jgi:hypothetical protein